MSARLPSFLCLLLLLSAPVRAGNLSVAMPRVANTFFADEPVQMSVYAQGAERLLQFSVFDYWNARRQTGRLRAGQGQPTLLSIGSKLCCGFYRLVLSDGSEQLEDTFCVIPRPYWDPGDYTLFGLHPDNGATEENFSAASQMGVRVVRQNMLWPNVEPARGVWDDALLDTWTGLARKYGMQMMVVLGYTPQWAGEKPENYLDGWVNAAWFTWHPKEPAEWGAYLDKVTSHLQGMSVSWPSPHVQPEQDPPAIQELPLAQSWELWNEADIMFYVGDWGRYNDLLHMGWAAGRRSLPDVPMIYGGSTGNFTAMGVTASGSARYCFDYIALHTGGDLEDALRVWYGGAQQIPWCVGAPRETIHTECYAQGRRGSIEFPVYNETPDELLRTYLTLKAWREVGFYRSGCLGGWIDAPGAMAHGTSLLRRGEDHLSPTPLYPAFACTRRLLSDATEVGPVDLGERVTAHVFLKHGRAMLSAWSDDGAQGSIALEHNAYQVDAFGGRRYFTGLSKIECTLTSKPTVIMNVHRRYLSEALRRRYRLLSDTPYGTPQTDPACYVWYARPLSEDLTTLLGSALPGKLALTVTQAARSLTQSAERGPQSLLLAQEACATAMAQVVTTCPSSQELPLKAANALWRLARIDEWLGEVADDRSGVWANLPVSDLELESLSTHLGDARRQLAAFGHDADLPCAQQMLDRAQRQMPRLRQIMRRGTYQAILHKIALTELLLPIEKPVVLRVVPILDFTTGRCFRKARLLEPGRTHTFTIWAYNALDHAVTGTLSLKLPPTWSPNSATLPFSAPAGQSSTPETVSVTLPDNPTPWKTVSSFTMDGMINVSLPESLADRPTVTIDGKLSTGEELSPMVHYVNVGRWLDDPNSNGVCARGSGSAARHKQKTGSSRMDEPVVRR